MEARFTYILVLCLYWGTSVCPVSRGSQASSLQNPSSSLSARCGSWLSQAFRSALTRDLWPRHKNSGAIKSTKLLFYPVVGVGKGVYFLYKGMSNVRELPRTVREAFESYRADILPFMGHLLIYLASSVSLTTYEELERSSPVPADNEAVIVVVDGFASHNALGEEVDHHFVRQFGVPADYQNAHLVEAAGENWDMPHAFIRAWEIAQHEGPIAHLEIHSDMVPGVAFINGDPTGASIFRDLPYQMAEILVTREEAYVPFENGEIRLARKRLLIDRIKTEMMAKDANIVLFGCSVAYGDEGSQLHQAIEETFLQKGGTVIAPKVDLFLDYPNYYTGKLVGGDLPMGNSSVNRFTRYSLASVYLSVRVAKWAQSIISPEGGELTVACPSIRQTTR